MYQQPMVSRRAFAFGGIVGVSALLSGCSAASTNASRKASASEGSTSEAGGSAAANPKTSSAPPSNGFMRGGYLMVLNQGRWVGPVDSAGAPSFSLIDAVVEHREGAAVPQYVRVTSAAPDGANTPAVGSDEHKALQRLVAAGVRLGVAIGSAPNAKAISAPDVIAHATQVRRASEGMGGLYDWIFIDEAVEHTPAGTNHLNDLQLIVDGVAKAGWSRIMINASGFTPANFHYLPQRTWAMARHFGLITPHSSTSAVARVVSSRSGAVVPGDLQFISYVKKQRAGSTPILKLEVPSTSSRFAQLPVSDQTALLDLWAQNQPKDGYRTLYPLFMPGARNGRGKAVQYDSATARTLWIQRSLMQRYG